MNATHLLAAPTDPQAWQQALDAFLTEKERRSGSRRTVESCSRMLQHFFGAGQEDAGAGDEPGGPLLGP